jgi:cbb3-type cytochrome oxidase subunit 3
MLYKSAALGMAGCCEGRDTQNCGWARGCIDYSRFAAGDCGTSCLSDTFVRKCTSAAAPYCVTWTYLADGIADYGCDSTSTNTIFTVRQTATDGAGDTTSTRLPTVAAAAVTIPAGSGNTTTRKTAKKLAIGAIIGIVVAVLFLFFFVIVGVFMLMKKRKKQKQIAANALLVANSQANRPQSQYQPPPQPPMQQGPPPPMPSQSPQPTVNGYFAPPVQHEEKFNGNTSVQAYAMTPISNPSTPAPAYAQPYAHPNGPPMPQQHNSQYQTPTQEVVSPLLQQHGHQYQPPSNGAHEVASPIVSQPPQQQHVVSSSQQYSHSNTYAHEVDAISVPHAPGKTGPVYEMGGR